MNQIELTISNNFFDKSTFNSFNQMLHKSAENQNPDTERLQFWSDIALLFDEVENVNPNSIKMLENYKNKIEGQKNWILEKTFISEQLLSFEKYGKNKKRLFFFTDKKKINEINSIIDFYEKNSLYLRKHQTIYRLSLFYLKNRNKKLAYFSIITLIKSLEDNGGLILNKWMSLLFNELEEFLSIDLINHLIIMDRKIFSDQNIRHAAIKFLKKTRKKIQEPTFSFIHFLILIQMTLEPICMISLV
jgi:hypothetical protein